jgi:C4-dicarboxylate-binding protein DctP
MRNTFRLCAWIGCLAGLLWLHQAQAITNSTQTNNKSKPVLLRFSHVVTPDTPKGLVAQKLKELVELRSHGAIQVEIYPNATLYGDRDEMEALQIGAIEMLAPSLSKFGRLGFSEFELFDLPFLFNNIQEVQKITQGSIGERLLQKLRRQQLVGLGYLTNGLRQMSANRPLLKPSDFAGLRMRIQASQVISSQMRALGAYPVVLPFSETRRALSKGVVDGTENALSNFWTQNMHLVQSDLSMTNHSYQGYAVITSERFWESLSTDNQNLIQEALADALAYGNEIADAQNLSALSAISQSGHTRIHTLNPDQRAQLRLAMQPVYEQLNRTIGSHWVTSVETVLAASRHKSPTANP